ncbi:MAG TPA: DUF4266 domain-containing protein [Polyangium sp.]|jgi:hypothetical protein|nr:DUF4266 domain-containing protein [Polyangium sp.]
MLGAFFRSAFILILLGFASGCATVQPWERGTLAKKKMQMDPDPQASALEQHVFEYREGASGGYGSVGGGCGCN